MRILFDNLFENASISATNESLNYPAINLVHPFLEKRFQSSGVSSVITLDFTEDQTMDCFFYAFHNTTSLSVVYKNSVAATLLTLNISSPEDVGIEYFASLTTIRSVEITINGPDPVYLGGVGGGVCYQMPDPLADYEPGNADNSDPVESPFGQTLQNYIKPLRALKYGFRENENSARKEIDTRYKSVGKGKPIYFDLYEDTREKEEPIYGKITNDLGFSYSPRRYNFELNILEAR